MKDLKPCPFCGGAAVWQDDGLKCSNCSAFFFGNTEKWNHREEERRPGVSPKDCPFCGGAADIVEQHDEAFGAWIFHVQCLRCHAKGGAMHTFHHVDVPAAKQEVVARWDFRIKGN